MLLVIRLNKRNLQKLVNGCRDELLNINIKDNRNSERKWMLVEQFSL